MFCFRKRQKKSIDLKSRSNIEFGTHDGQLNKIFGGKPVRSGDIEL